MLGGDGLKPSSRGYHQVLEGKPKVTDGPFAETKELVAGFTIIEVGSREEALKWVERWPVEDGHGEGGARVARAVRSGRFRRGVHPAIERQGRLLQERQSQSR